MKNTLDTREKYNEKLGMIIDVLWGEVRFNGKIVKCGTSNNEHMRIKL